VDHISLAEPLDGDALEALCFSDPLFRQRYDGWTVVGRGSFATVVKTRSRDARREIALKVFVNLEPDALDRVREEVRAAQSLASPYVVDIYSLFDRGTLAWFEMEWVDGSNLQDYLRAATPVGASVSAEASLDIALAVSRAIWSAHRRGVLHRDVKPSNILIARSRCPAAKVGDFGTARVADTTMATPRGLVVGTPRYASPESLAGRRVGPPHDVYGLGMVFHALFTGGRLPHDVPQETPLRVLRRLYATKPLPPIHLAPESAPELADIVMRCLDPRPTKRPSVDWVVKALENVRRGMTPVATHRAAGLSSDVTTRAWRGAVLLATTATISV
jgi:serine/threonine-protein kinase